MFRVGIVLPTEVRQVVLDEDPEFHVCGPLGMPVRRRNLTRNRMLGPELPPRPGRATLARMRPSDQKNQPFEEPPLSEIPGISRMHVAGMEATNDDMVWIGAGMHQLLLRTIGRK